MQAFGTSLSKAINTRRMGPAQNLSDGTRIYLGRSRVGAEVVVVVGDAMSIGGHDSSFLCRGSGLQ